MKYTYTILLLILLSGMNCNNGVKEPVMYSEVVDFDRFQTEKEKLTTCLLELELLNLRLERLSKKQVSKPGLVHPITNAIDY